MTDGILTGYLEGTLKTQERVETERHLIDCEACRSQLAYFMRILDEDVETEEESILQTAMQEWDSAGAPVEQRRRAVSAKWTALAASVLLALGIGLFYRVEPAVPTYDEVVAMVVLNQETRDFESRLSLFDSADVYLPFVAQRSSRDALATDIAQLADDVVSSGEAVTSHTQGLVSLAQHDFDQAVVFLEQAIIESGTAAARNDLGVAYMEGTWASAGLAADYLEQARTQFEIAADLDPDSLAPFFNLVLWYEGAGLEAETRDHAERYLERDSDSDWATEIESIRNSHAI
jgi:tetratricopeptide (TPR) repeat protein